MEMKKLNLASITQAQKLYIPRLHAMYKLSQSLKIYMFWLHSRIESVDSNNLINPSINAFSILQNTNIFWLDNDSFDQSFHNYLMVQDHLLVFLRCI